MRTFFSIYMLAAAAFVSGSCQQKQQQQQGNYKIVGTAEGYADGSTFYLTTDLNTGTPIDSTVVKNGKFDLIGNTDTTQLALLFDKNNSQINAPFFLEPGTIKIEMKKESGKSRVSGSTVNREWQTMNDKIQEYSDKMQEIMSSGSENLTEAQRANLNAHLQQAQQDAIEIIVNTTERNIDNELGFFLVLNYMDDPSFSAEKRKELIGKMPEAMRQRPAVKTLEETIAAAQKTEAGNAATDITLPSVDGTPMSLLGEVKKHKLTLVDFWASWCGPCRQEMPSVVALYKQYKDKGLGIVGISLDSDKTAWTKAIGDLGITWPQMSDLKGWKSEAARLYAVNSIPQTFLIDQDGKIVAKGLRGSQLAEFVKDTLK